MRRPLKAWSWIWIAGIVAGGVPCLAPVPCESVADASPVSDVQFNVTITELPPALLPKKEQIREHILAAAKMWTDAVEAKPCSIEIVCSVRDVVEGDPD